MSAQISKIKAREVLDSRGNPTVEAEVILENGVLGRAIVPSGASTGSREALELRDHDQKRYLGKGVLQAVSHINGMINTRLYGLDASKQQEIDEILLALDNSPNKEKLGANALLAVSFAVAHAAAQYENVPLFVYLNKAKQAFSLPVPMLNIINGGVHADNNIDFQEFMILPLGFTIFADALRASVEVFHALKALLKAKHYNTNVGDEGGFAPDLPNQQAAVEFILEAIVKAGFKPKQDMYLGFDIASNELYCEGKYHLPSEKKSYQAHEFVNYLSDLVRQYPIISIEDGMAENDWQGWDILTKQLGKKVQLVGDDLFVTNTNLLARGIKEHIANAILIKPNQIGTLTETFSAITMAKNAHYNTVISHRSGETEDTTIADLAVATNAGQIKTGSLSRTDRMAKYNQLLRIEEILGSKASYAGSKVFQSFLG